MTPLAEILRPTTIETYIGQQHLIGPGAVLRTLIDSGNIPSMILWGPPGIGKTTMAMIISQTLSKPFYTLSAISSGVKDVREVISLSEKENGSILFIDEIHRFNKAQQDSLLGAVEKGTITLIGATTENPSFEVIPALLSRCQVYILKEFGEAEMFQLIERVEKHYKNIGIEILIKESDALMRISGGDARKLLNAIELIVNKKKTSPIIIDNKTTTEVIQQNLVYYDKQGESHYNIISAFIKSMRGGDPNATVYWLARMIAAGEDPLFIARRMLIFASEDIGNANPNALLLANACYDAVHKIGYPECRINLSQCAVYLACSAKSNSTYMAINNALELVEQTGDQPVPLHIRNAPTQLMKDLGYHEGYLYAHNYEGNHVNQEYMPDILKGHKLYEPGTNTREEETRKILRHRWQEKYGY